MEPWFRARRYGYGAGLPIAWQGWALLGAWLLLVVLVGTALEEHPTLGFALLLPATITLIIISARRTRGGWRWRWGE